MILTGIDIATTSCTYGSLLEYQAKGDWVGGVIKGIRGLEWDGRLLLTTQHVVLPFTCSNTFILSIISVQRENARNKELNRIYT